MIEMNHYSIGTGKTTFLKNLYADNEGTTWLHTPKGDFMVIVSDVHPEGMRMALDQRKLERLIKS